MSKIPKLSLKLWQDLVYFLFVGIIPVVITALELFQVEDSKAGLAFKITFASVGALLLVIVILRTFVFKGYIAKLQEKCILLEHDYSIEVGKKENIEGQWSKYKAIIYGYHAIIILVALGLAVLFISAIADQLLKFRVASILIFSSVLVGIFWKLVLYIWKVLKV